MRDEHSTTENLLAELAALRQRVSDLEAAKDIEIDRYRALFEQTNDAVFIISLDHIHLECNQKAADMLHCRIEDIVGRNIQDFIAPTEAEDSVNQGERLLRGEQLPVYERTFRRADGTEFPAEINLVLARDSNGQPSHLHSIVRDISERKWAEQERIALSVERERVKILGDFIQDIGHEFRTPLSIMNLCLYLMAKEDYSSEQLAERMKVLKDQIGNIEDLIESMLIMSRLDSHATRIVFSSFDIIGLLQQLMSFMEKEINEKNLSITLKSELACLVIKADLQQINLALKHILQNAIQYTPEDGQITISVSAGEETVMIEFEDTGIGIGIDHLPRIFERFYKADFARTDRGAGLGLPIAQKIIQIHQGSIEADSIPGEGSIFRVILPITGKLKSEYSVFSG